MTSLVEPQTGRFAITLPSSSRGVIKPYLLARPYSAGNGLQSIPLRAVVAVDNGQSVRLRGTETIFGKPG